MGKYHQIALALLVGFGLSACGSSGGGSSTQPENSQTAKDTKTGGVFIFTGENENLTLTKVALQNPNLSSIDVDGRTIQLERGGYSGSWTIIKEGSGDNERELHVCCGKYENVRFGVYDADIDDSGNDKFYFFYNGSPTTNMPTTGAANYTGHSTFASADVDGTIYGNLYEDYLKGTAQLTANFNTKTLTGTLNLNEGNVAPIYINSQISGNNFTGTATTATFNTVAEVEGKFYGNNAKELGGVYDDGKYWGGAFGASQ